MTGGNSSRRVPDMKFQVIRTALGCALCLPASAEIESDIPLGIEAVTGIRSGYVHRGFDLADTSLEFQFAGEVTLSNENSLHFGLSHLAESDGDFSETAGYLERKNSPTAFTQESLPPTVIVAAVSSTEVWTWAFSPAPQSMMIGNGEMD